MKKTLIILSGVFLLVCNAYAQKKIYGKWKLQEVEVRGDEIKPEIIIPSIYKFKRNGSYWMRPAKLKNMKHKTNIIGKSIHQKK